MHHLGVGSTAKPLVHVKSTFSIPAVRPFVLPASAVSFLGGPVHSSLHNVATLWTLQQLESSSMLGNPGLEQARSLPCKDSYLPVVGSILIHFSVH